MLDPVQEIALQITDVGAGLERAKLYPDDSVALLTPSPTRRCDPLQFQVVVDAGLLVPLDAAPNQRFAARRVSDPLCDSLHDVSGLVSNSPPSSEQPPGFHSGGALALDGVISPNALSGDGGEASSPASGATAAAPRRSRAKSIENQSWYVALVVPRQQQQQQQCDPLSVGDDVPPPPSQQHSHEEEQQAPLWVAFHATAGFIALQVEGPGPNVPAEEEGMEGTERATVILSPRWTTMQVPTEADPSSSEVVNVWLGFDSFQSFMMNCCPTYSDQFMFQVSNQLEQLQ